VRPIQISRSTSAGDPEGTSTGPSGNRWRSELGACLLAGDDIGGWAVLIDARASGHDPAYALADALEHLASDLQIATGVVATTAAKLLRRLAGEPDGMVQRLQQVTDAALAHIDLDDLLDEVTARTCAVLEADTMAIFLRDGDDLVAMATRCPEGVLREQVRVPMGTGLAGRIAAHSGPSIVDDLVADADAAVHRDKGVRSLVGVPLMIGGKTIGVVHVGSREPAHFTDDDGRFLKLVADRMAQAIDRARLFEAEREARTLAEATQHRLAFLTAAGDAMGRSLDWETTLETVVHQAVPFLADWCAVDLVGTDGDVRCAAAAHVDPTMTTVVRELHDSRPPTRNEARGVGRVLRTGQPAFWPEIQEGGMAVVAGSEERLALFRRLDPHSAMVLPIRLRGRVVGTLTFVYSASGRRYTEADLALAEEVARRAAMALDNARLFAEHREVARTLQASLLPPHLPDIPGVDLDGLYRAGGEGVEVGGDFYDVFLTEPGDWALVVGDVCGKGAEAAGVTAMGRYTLRAAAMQARRPSRVLHVLNEAMLRNDEVARPFLTVAYARLQLGEPGDAAKVTVGCGGHPLPLILRASGRVETVGVPGTLLGCFPELDVEDASAELRSGDALVLYTDGVEEARDEAGSMLGAAGLERVLAGCAGRSAAGINRAVHEAVMTQQAGRPSDDVAVLTMRLL
jgi:serine phosphatase RsbU (regulator of sigma subunit)/putative methionine-R-sulfoxide reductase with GAF domain